MNRKIWQVLLASTLVLLAGTAAVALAAVEPRADVTGAAELQIIQAWRKSVEGGWAIGSR